MSWVKLLQFSIEKVFNLVILLKLIFCIPSETDGMIELFKLIPVILGKCNKILSPLNTNVVKRFKLSETLAQEASL